MRALLSLLLVAPLIASPVTPPDPAGPILVRPVLLDPADPARVQLGGLRYLGGWALEGRHPAFGGFSAMAVRGDRFILVSDKGYVARFRFDGRQISGPMIAALPTGPGNALDDGTRDSESMTVGRDGRVWIGFENYGQIWRYAPGLGRGETYSAPAAMAKWPGNKGAEAIVALADGRFLVMSEGAREDSDPKGTSRALLFSGDPTRASARPAVIHYRPPTGYSVTDAAQLSDGRIIILHRRFVLTEGIAAIVSIVPVDAFRKGRIVSGRIVARLASPLTVDNMEAIAVSTEGGRQRIWIASDDNFYPIQRTLLMKFALDEDGG